MRLRAPVVLLCLICVTCALTWIALRDPAGTAESRNGIRRSADAPSTVGPGAEVNRSGDVQANGRDDGDVARGPRSEEGTGDADETEAPASHAMSGDVDALPVLPPLPQFSAELDGIDILALHLDHACDADGLVARPDEMRARVRTGGGELHRIESADGAPVDLAPFVGRDTVLEFGPGTFELAWDAWFAANWEIDSLEIRGAGMDRTVLVGPPSYILHTGERTVRNVVVRDLTLDAAGGNTRFQSQTALSIALDRVRFKGWNSTGFGAAIGVGDGGGRAFVVARDCEFLGRSVATSGSRLRAISLRGYALVSLARCRFVDIDPAVSGVGEEGRSRIFFEDCTFERTRLLRGNIPPGGSDRLSVTVRGGHVKFGTEGTDVNEIRRLWGAGLASSVEGVTFEPWIPPRSRPRRRR